MGCPSGVFRPDKVVVRPERLRLLPGRDWCLISPRAQLGNVTKAASSAGTVLSCTSQEGSGVGDGSGGGVGPAS